MIQRWKEIIGMIGSIPFIDVIGLVETKQKVTAKTRHFGKTRPRTKAEILRDIEDYLALGGIDGSRRAAFISI